MTFSTDGEALYFCFYPQIIKLITKSPHGVDDGWWEGELDGKIGNFPSLVVEECDENGEPLTDAEDESPPPSAPPSFAVPAPPMVLHQATPPEGESPSNTSECDFKFPPINENLN